MPLPPGLSPVEAGRIGLWLLGKRNQRAAIRRRRNTFRAYGPALINRFTRIVCPWLACEYPGAEFFISRLCGVSPRTVEGWIRGRSLSSRHARTLADYIEDFDGPGVARELRAYADERDKRVRPGRPPHKARGERLAQ
jgi:hypothetical protein